MTSTADRGTPSIGSMDLERHLADPALRQAYVTPMFDLIAPRYDRFTRAFSFGMDARWKAWLVRKASASFPQAAVVADVATGTGDLAFALGRVRPDLAVAAVDVSSRMLALALSRRINEPGRVCIAHGDLAGLPFPDASLDGVTAGYALRNAPDWRASLRELARVIRPGGHLLTLDFFLPRQAPWRAAFLGWLAVAGRAVGWWWHREPMAYGYLAASIRHFAGAEAYEAALVEHGFRVLAVERRLGGGIALHQAVRR